MIRAALVAAVVVVTPHLAGAQDADSHAIVFDAYMTPNAGAEDLLTVQHLLASAEDRWLPRRLGQESSRSASALGILYRGGKFIALDVPQDHFLMVVAHEVFGHGARFRELGDGRIAYGFDAPIPYGSGDAFTSFRGEFPVSPLGMLNVSASGIEAQNALADGIAAKVIERGRIHYREAWLYFESRITGMTYILTRIAPVGARTRRRGLSRALRGGMYSSLRCSHAKVRPAAGAPVARRSDDLLRHLCLRRFVRRNWQHDRPCAAASIGARNQDPAFPGLCACTLWDRVDASECDTGRAKG